MYTCVVIDDEKLAREKITSFIDTRRNWQVVGEAAEFEKAHDIVLEQQPDACFVDINIIGGSGIDLVDKMLPKTRCNWVFTTAYSEHAIKAFDLDATDYLLKPFAKDRFMEVLYKLENRPPKNTINDKAMLAVKSIGRVQFVNPKDILWIKGSANYVELHCKDSMLLHRETLSNLELQLDPQQFVRVHRSAMVNIERVASLSSELGRFTLLQLCNGDEVKISSAYKQVLFEKLGLEE